MLAERVISETRCRKFLLSDGITSQEFSVNTFPQIVEGFSIDARAAKKLLPAYGNVFSVAKNLDEYQFKICALVPSLPDSPLKITLQKYRIAIAAAFVKLANVVKSDSSALPTWTVHACALLVEASEAYIRSTTNDQQLKKTSMASAFAFFGLHEGDVDKYLANTYDQ